MSRNRLVKINRSEVERAVKLAARNLDKYSEAELEDLILGLLRNRVYFNYSVLEEGSGDVTCEDLSQYILRDNNSYE